MHLKSLTMKGFKSFAPPTTLVLEPGVTCVVGPNGSGKSNVVDALSWVMGEQGPKSLRGGKMEDVIFAGTSGRAPLGRAEVSLTIDNCDGALPIDYAEVTISRIMFRSGGSEYSINGSPCRLLDVQELLSDSGIGRGMHVVVGQGQLDAILHATAEDRRGFIEEAAGVIKHRRRKDKALRKLDALNDKMNRLADLTTELRRQLKPLGRQAEVARRAVVVQADARDARLRLLADDLHQMRSQLELEQADEAVVRERRGEIEALLLADQAREAELESGAEAVARELSDVQELWFGLSGTAERFRSVASVARERSRNLVDGSALRGGTDPEEMEAEARELEREDADLESSVRRHVEELAERSAVRLRCEAEMAELERRLDSSRVAESDRREKHARVAGEVGAIRSRLEARESELARVRSAVLEAVGLAEEASAKFARLEQEVVSLGDGEVGLDARYEAVAAKRDEADRELSDLRAEEAEIVRLRAAAAARVEVLGAAVRSSDATPDWVFDDSGVHGSLSDLIRPQPGYERALAAALGDLAGGVLADTLQIAARIAAATPDSAVKFLVPSEDLVADGGSAGDLGSGAGWLADFVDIAEPARAALGGLLRDTAFAETLDQAVELVSRGTVVRAATAAGDLVSRDQLRSGAPGDTSVIQLVAQRDEAEKVAADLEARVHRLRFKTEAAEDAAAEAQRDLDSALAELNASDAAMAAAADRLAALAGQVKAARADETRLSESSSTIERALEHDRVKLSEISQRLEELRSAVPDVGVPIGDRDEMAAALAAARSAETDARLALSMGEERVRALRAQVERLRASAQREREARLEAEVRGLRRMRQAEIAQAVLAAAEIGADLADGLVGVAAAERTRAEQGRLERDKTLAELRRRIRESAAELELLTDSVHRDEMVRAEQRIRIQQIGDKSMEDFGVPADVLLGEYGPDVLVLPSLPEPGPAADDRPPPEAYRYVRAQQERRLASAERSLALLGRVNPLALEEFAALEERQQFLSDQLDDLRSSRRDLLTIVKDVDDRVQQVFAEAFADTAREFERVFSRLFPGGEGRLILSDPDDMLATGVEVEARPAGKRVKRLSLLSGGERSLTAVAFLIALFKARPSPFYVLDEVEAALDDVNLGRLLDVIDELRQDSQLIVVTHQRRTMEAADALYGVAMRDDGVSQVISQRLREKVLL
ncbi:MAG: chromosome segregation protein SMC [Candidatus Nanopelagicales bacterium]|nr:chromosome segregation protein SMC [Candidatus Nanopelagicales bacterium]